jgi:hypothetical protein
MDDLERARPVRQAADETALLQRHDQAVDAGFGLKVERILHLVEGGRHAAFAQAFLDEAKQFELFACQHGPRRRDDSWAQIRNKSRTPYLFALCSASRCSRNVSPGAA